MAIDGKEARRKAAAGELIPSSAIKHQKPFSTCTSKHGSLDRGEAAQTRASCLEESDKFRTTRSVASNPIKIPSRRESTSGLTHRSANTV